MKWKVKYYNSGSVYSQIHIAKDLKDVRTIARQLNPTSQIVSISPSLLD
tara:strand:- start:123 stop:269 length:147 start_codon:yes stop_codon:yes gene_type:complete